MPFSKEDRILIKKSFKLKGYNDKHLVRKFLAKARMLAASARYCNGYGLLGWSVVLPAVPDDASSTLILMTN